MSRLIRNAVANAVLGLLPLVLSFLVTPITIRVLGVQTYGLLQLILSVLGYLTLVDLNMSVALVKYVAEYGAQRRDDVLMRLTRTAMAMYGAAGLVMVSLAWMSSGYIVTWLGIRSDWAPAAQISIQLLAIVAFLSLLQGALISLLNGRGEYGLTAGLTSSLAIVTSVGTCIVGWKHGEIQAVVAFQAAVNLLFLCITLYLVLKRYPLRVLIPAVDGAEARKLLRFSALSFFGRAAAVVDNSVDRLVVGAILGAGHLAFYSVPLTLARVIGSFNTRLASVLLPAASALNTAAERDKLHHLYLRATRIIALFNSFVVGVIVSVGPVFLTVWLGPEFGAQSASVLKLLAVGYFLSSLTAVPTFFVDGLGFPYISAGTYLAQVCLYSALVVGLTKLGGMTGTALAYALACALVSPTFIWYAENKVLRVPGRATRFFYLRVVLAAGTGAFMNTFVSTALSVQGWAQLVFLGVLVIFVQALSLCFYGLIGLKDVRAILQLLARVRSRDSLPS